MTEELNQQTNSQQTKPFDGTSWKQDGQNASLSDGRKDKTADTLMQEHDKEYFELFEGIKTQERIIELRKEDIHKNAVGHYDACRHSDLIRDIEIATQIIEVYKAKISEAKRQKKRQIEFLEGEVKFLKTFLCELTRDRLQIVRFEKEIKILKMEVERE